MTIHDVFARVRCLLAAAALVAACSKPEPIVITVSRAEIQEHLDAAFPIEKRRMMTDITLSEPQAVLPSGSDRAGLSIVITAKPPLIGPFRGKLTATGKIDYRADEKSFYLKEMTVDALEVEGVDDTVMERLRGPIEAVALAYLAEHPIYAFKGRNLKEIAAEYVLRSVSVENGELRATIVPPL